MHVLSFFPLKIQLLNFTTYRHTQNTLLAIIITELILFFIAYLRQTYLFLICEGSILLLVSKSHWEKDGFFSVNKQCLEEKRRYIFEWNIVKNCWKGWFRQSKLQNVLHLPTMVADRIFRYISTDHLKFEMTAKKWNYLVAITARIQNVISRADK